MAIHAALGGLAEAAENNGDMVPANAASRLVHGVLRPRAFGGPDSAIDGIDSNGATRCNHEVKR